MNVQDLLQRLMRSGKRAEIIKPRAMGSFTALRKLRAETGQFTVLHPVMAAKAFGLAAVRLAEKRADGFIGEDGTRDYYLGEQIPIKFIKEKKTYGNSDKKTHDRAKNKKRRIGN